MQGFVIKKTTTQNWFYHRVCFDCALPWTVLLHSSDLEVRGSLVSKCLVNNFWTHTTMQHRSESTHKAAPPLTYCSMSDLVRQPESIVAHCWGRHSRFSWSFIRQRCASQPQRHKIPPEITPRAGLDHSRISRRDTFTVSDGKAWNISLWGSSISPCYL